MSGDLLSCNLLCEEERDLVIIGAGPAGLAAAISAYRQGVRDILIIEREARPGGILNQCIHDGFGLHKFSQALTGPEYIDRFIKEVAELNIEILTGSLVTGLSRDKVVTVSNRKQGLFRIRAEAVILAMGSRERSAGAIGLPGQRPAGIYTAGLAQNLMNIHNIMIGKRAVILGSGDIGLIMARRLTLEGASVEAVIELMPYPGGLQRNIVQCLQDYKISLRLSQTVIRVEGKDRVEAVLVSGVDDRLEPVPGTEERIECDTLILSVGLIPENELSREAGIQLDPATEGPLVTDSYSTGVPGIFCCGNVLHIHDVVDYVSDEAEKAGVMAAGYILRESRERSGEDRNFIYMEAGTGIKYILPQLVKPDFRGEFSLRVEKPGKNVEILFLAGDKVLFKKKYYRVDPSQMLRISCPDGLLTGQDLVAGQPAAVKVVVE